MNKKELVEFYQLLVASLEGTISDQQQALLLQKLREDEEATHYYIDFLSIYTNLCCPTLTDSIFEKEDKSDTSVSYEPAGYNADIWDKLLETERTAPAVERPREKAPPTIVNEFDENRRTPRQVNKFSLYTAVVSLAAMLLMILFVKFTSQPLRQQEVATLTDAIGAIWDDIHFNAGIGSRFSTRSDPVRLLEGIVKITYDQGVDMVIEGPAEWEFTSPSECILNYGRLYAQVSSRGVGFTVVTSNSRVVDLGTEFGVLAEKNGATELHVFKGKTVFIGETRDKLKNVLDAIAGQALRLEHLSDSVKNIKLDSDTFVRSIDSQVGLLWRGQKQINLADIVGRGDGFGTGRVDIGIDPETGTFCDATVGRRDVANKYASVADSVFIDGVFVPDGRSEQVVSSAGHVFAECPPTHGCFYSPVLNTPSQFRKGLSLYLDETNYSLPQNPCIFMHSNLGITFDLNTFRQRLPGVKVVQFQTQVGVSNTTPGPFNADIWVLMDGQVRYKKTSISQKGLLDTLEINIREQDSFLTLIATEGENTQDNVEYARSSIGCDWVVFGRPVLKLE